MQKALENPVCVIKMQGYSMVPYECNTPSLYVQIGLHKNIDTYIYTYNPTCPEKIQKDAFIHRQ